MGLAPHNAVKPIWIASNTPPRRGKAGGDVVSKGQYRPSDPATRSGSELGCEELSDAACTSLISMAELPHWLWQAQQDHDAAMLVCCNGESARLPAQRTSSTTSEALGLAVQNIQTSMRRPMQMMACWMRLASQARCLTVL